MATYTVTVITLKFSILQFGKKYNIKSALVEKIC